MKDRQICFDFTDGSEESFKMGKGGPAVCDGKLHGIFSWNNKKWACGEESSLKTESSESLQDPVMTIRGSVLLVS